MARGKAVPVMGIWLKRTGDDVVVTAETVTGEEVELIREPAEGAVSHNISEHGIRARFDKDFWDRAEATAALKRAVR